MDAKTKRLEFHEILCQILGCRHVYYNPPESIRLCYPCIVYHKSSEQKIPADDIAYLKHRSYQVTVIDCEPDSPIADKVAELPRCSFGNAYVSENLYHTSYTVFY